jgi:hypothetical protein
MDDQELRTLLEKVHAEIEQTQSVDENGRELLRDLETDIRGLLARSQVKQPELPIVERLDNTIKHFEVTHPDLTATLSELMTILSNAGI